MEEGEETEIKIEWLAEASLGETMAFIPQVMRTRATIRTVSFAG